MLDLQKVFTIKEFGKIRLGGISWLIKKLYHETKQIKGHGTGYFCADTLKIGRRTFWGWLEGSPISISYFLKLLELWKFTCKKSDEDIHLLLKSLVPKIKRFSVMGGRSVELPLKLTAKLAYLTGYIIGDGCLSGLTETQKSHFIIRIASDTKRFLKTVIQPMFIDLFSVRGHVYKIMDSKCYELQVYSSVLYLFFQKMFELPAGKKKGKLVIPQLILKASSKIKMAFISGFFDADGCIYEKGKLISFGQADKRFLESLSKLLIDEGILTRPIGIRKKELGTTYDFSLRWSTLPKFLDSVQFLHPDRIKRAANLKSMLAY